MLSAAELSEMLTADGVLLYAIDGQELSVVDLWPPHPSAASLRLRVGFGVTGLVARTGKPVLLDADSPRNILHRRLLRLGSDESCARLCVPLPGVEGEVVGVLAAHRPVDRPFTGGDLDAAQQLAALLGLSHHAHRLWRTVNRHQTERDRLVEAAISAQEAQRRRIAFDLHDGVTTALASMAFHLSAADLTVTELAEREADSWARDALARARAELASARALADFAYNETRAAISGLHSLVLDDLGLVAAIESLVRTVTGDHPTVEFLVDPTAEVSTLPDHAAAALYRVAQEALANALKHADAARIVLSLHGIDDAIVLGCSDDGSGFDLAVTSDDDRQHVGLRSIAERCALIGAALRVESLVGRGTTLLVELPLR
ncbi:GAF domain-containing sensor histidine kinase [Nocardia camponoti]|uniref:GAF domain-containing sensor histidine kinase n=1 Tax=Nocardia camponoti TaxID=1616106 RepID=UPI001E3E6A9D|nr:GAF domain-containing protein [Nocardia camponoti]